MSRKFCLVAFKITQIISFLLGLAPYRIDITYDPSRTSGLTYKLSYSKIGIAYNVFLIIAFVGITAYAVPVVIKAYIANELIVMLIESASALLGNIVVIVTIANYSLYQRQIISIGNQLGEFDSKFGIQFLNIHGNKPGPIYLLVIVVALLTSWIGLLVLGFLFFKVIFQLPWVFCVPVVSCYLTQYSLIVIVLKERIKNLNKAFPTIVQCSAVYHNNVDFPERITNNQLNVEHFLKVRQAWSVIYKISCEVSDFYSFSILLMIFFFSCGCIDNLYYNIVFFTYFGTISWFDIVMEIFRFVALIYPLTMLCENIKRFTSEMEKTSDIIYDIKKTYVLTPDIKSELHDFLMEIGHRKVDFTAYGFFSIDCTLLNSMFVTIVTYLIIMFQFKPPTLNDPYALR